jgi:hypothetical protein
VRPCFLLAFVLLLVPLAKAGAKPLGAAGEKPQ